MTQRIMGDRQLGRNVHKDEMVLVRRMEMRDGSALSGHARVNLSMDDLSPLSHYTSLHVDFDRTDWQHSPAGFAD
jgi:hypothetical protein